MSAPFGTMTADAAPLASDQATSGPDTATTTLASRRASRSARAASSTSDSEKCRRRSSATGALTSTIRGRPSRAAIALPAPANRLNRSCTQSGGRRVQQVADLVEVATTGTDPGAVGVLARTDGPDVDGHHLDLVGAT